MSILVTGGEGFVGLGAIGGGWLTSLGTVLGKTRDAHDVSRLEPVDEAAQELLDSGRTLYRMRRRGSR